MRKRCDAQQAYKNSRFNVGYKEGNDLLLYNTRTGAFLRLTDTRCSDYRWLLQSASRNGPPAGMDADVRQALQDGGFVIPSDIDEIEYIRYQAQQVRSMSDRSLSLVIIPTNKCNMNCSYCFEHNKANVVMSKAVQDKIVDVIRARLKNGCKDVAIEWFGGEPLICVPMIKALSSRIMNLCRRHGAHYSACMITNGTLLTKSVARDLARLKVNAVQVTLDGPPKIHDRRRPYVSGKGTFNRILKNIEDVCRIVNVSVRCNVDKDNIRFVRDLAEILHGRGIAKYIRLYYSPVHNGAECCADAGQGCRAIYSQKEFARLESQLKMMTHDMGFRIEPAHGPTCSSCGATFPNSLVIDARGDLYKCSETIGVESEQIGTIHEGVRINDIYLKWINFDALQFRKCRSCKVLPLCMGWCPDKVKDDRNAESCLRVKYNLIEELKLTHALKRHAKSAECCAAS